jgi:hypothetical protein
MVKVRESPLEQCLQVRCVKRRGCHRSWYKISAVLVMLEAVVVKREVSTTHRSGGVGSI